MGVRLILVSVVAGLGITLPSVKQVSSWKDSAQGWVSARLADMDARMPADEKAFIYVVDSAPFPEDEPAAAVIAVPAPKATPAPVATVAAKVASVECNSPETLASGIDTPSAPMDLDEIEALTGWAVVENLDDPFDQAQGETLKSFAADRERVVAAPAPSQNLAVAVQPEPALSSTDLTDSDDMQEGSAYLFETEPAKAASEPVTNALEVGEDLYPGIAYALNREAEGLGLNESIQPRPAAPVAQPANSTSSLSQAVKLTREAVYAWANLLHAPAVVTINH